jgi:molecular chaperone GrpE
MNPKRQPHQVTSDGPGDPAVSDVVGNGAAQPDGAPEDVAPESGEGAADAAPSGSASSAAHPSGAEEAEVSEEADAPPYYTDDAAEAELGFEAQALESDSGGAEWRVELDLDELAARAGKADEYLQLAQRTRADFENYRKRATREVAAAQERGVARLAKELLPAIDNLDRAVQASIEIAPESDQPAPGPDAQLISGIRLVHADVIAALARVGIEPYSPEGKQFDPQYHEAVAQAPIEGAAPGTVVEVYQVGYRIGEMVLRPARVLVAA